MSYFLSVLSLLPINLFDRCNMKDRWYILTERTHRRKSGPHKAIQLLDMLQNDQIRDITPIEDGDGDICDAANVPYYVLDEFEVQLLTARQRGYLKFLGYTGSLYITQDDCSIIIERLKAEGSRDDNLSFDECVAEAEAQTLAYLRGALVELLQYGRSPIRKTKPKRKSLLVGLFGGIIVGLWKCVFAITKVFARLTGRGAVLIGKGTARGAKLAKSAAVSAIEYEKENKVLARAATSAAEGAKKGAASVAEFMAAKEEEPRTWLSADGKHKIEATLIDIRPDSAILQNANGQQIEVKTAQLSPADNAYISERRAD